MAKAGPRSIETKSSCYEPFDCHEGDSDSASTSFRCPAPPPFHIWPKLRPSIIVFRSFLATSSFATPLPSVLYFTIRSERVFHDAFMNSDPARNKILDDSVNQCGTRFRYLSFLSFGSRKNTLKCSRRALLFLTIASLFRLFRHSDRPPWRNQAPPRFLASPKVGRSGLLNGACFLELLPRPRLRITALIPGGRTWPALPAGIGSSQCLPLELLKDLVLGRRGNCSPPSQFLPWCPAFCRRTRHPR